MPEPSLELIQSLLVRSLDGQALLRRDVADLRTVALSLVDHSRRVERRLEELRDDIELMVKAEVMGRIGHFEVQYERKLDALTDRVSALEARVPATP